MKEGSVWEAVGLVLGTVLVKYWLFLRNEHWDWMTQWGTWHTVIDRGPAAVWHAHTCCVGWLQGRVEKSSLLMSLVQLKGIRAFLCHQIDLLQSRLAIWKSQRIRTTTLITLNQLYFSQKTSKIINCGDLVDSFLRRKNTNLSVSALACDMFSIDNQAANIN